MKTVKKEYSMKDIEGMQHKTGKSKPLLITGGIIVGQLLLAGVIFDGYYIYQFFTWIF